MIRRLICKGLIAFGVLVAAGGAIALPMARHTDGPRLLLTKATAPLAHDNSRNGRAVLSPSNMKPGETRTGEVRIANRGSSGDMFLVMQPLGGPLAERLVLSIDDLSKARVVTRESPVAGPRTCWPLGRYDANEARTYRFLVTFPAGPNDNEYMGQAASADFDWLESDDAPDGCAAAVPSPSTPSDATHSIELGGMRLAISPGPYRFAQRTGTTRVGIHCLSSRTGRCVGQLELDRRRTGQGRGLAMAALRFSVKAGTTRRLTIKLNARARKRITASGTVPVRAYVIARDARGHAVRAAYRDKLVYGTAKKRHHR